MQLGGDYIVQATWVNLDSDSDSEFVCLSRSGGSGAYYHGIIIDLSHEAFTFRTFYSHGYPRIDPNKQLIGLGKTKNPSAPTASMEFVYTDYVWDNGLRLSKTADN